MAFALLAPVPCCHLASAVAEFDERQTIAFGTNLDKEDFPIEEGAPVLIHASRPEFGRKELFKGPVVSFVARFIQYTTAVRDGPASGTHKHQEYRPSSTLIDKGLIQKDSAWQGFWEVTGFRRAKTSIPLGSLKRAGSGTVIKSPIYGPVAILLDNGLFEKL